jgi:hypothetical protein
MGMRIEGLDKLQARLKKSGVNAAKELAGGLKVEAERIMTAAKRITPVDQGTLRSSGHVQAPVIRRKTASVVLGFGGAASDYALIQHERTDFTHTVGQAKFLEQPVKSAAVGFGNRVARNLDLF